jgi:eukaryotic-like serine/threonine-protein kinase
MESVLRDGDVVGAYQIEGVVGSGGMGLVYRARHALSERCVALKIQRPDQARAIRGCERMMREASILAQLEHPGVPKFYECGLLEDGRPWIAMELVPGQSLARRLVHGPLDADEVVVVVAAVANVLAAAHAIGITHRDLKPDNIFLTAGDYPLRVLDWGIAYDQAGPRYTNHDEAIGTPTYMSPEQARGGPTDGHCDVYGLGVIAYYLLSGSPPFAGANPIEIIVQHFSRAVPPLAPRCPEAPYGLVELVERMLAKDLSQRPTAAEVHAILRDQHAEASAPAYYAYSIEPDSIEAPTQPLRLRGS